MGLIESLSSGLSQALVGKPNRFETAGLFKDAVERLLFFGIERFEVVASLQLRQHRLPDLLVFWPDASRLDHVSDTGSDLLGHFVTEDAARVDVLLGQRCVDGVEPGRPLDEFRNSVQPPLPPSGWKGESQKTAAQSSVLRL